MTLVFNNFWIEFFPAIVSLLRNDMVSFAKDTAILFPSQAKCDYFNFGSSGTIQQIDALCLLPQNVVNEKIFVFLYFWMSLLLIFSLLHLICVAIKIRHQCKKNHDFGYGLALSIMKKNLSPILVDDLLEARKLNTHWHLPKTPSHYDVSEKLLNSIEIEISEDANSNHLETQCWRIK